MGSTSASNSVASTSSQTPSSSPSLSSTPTRWDVFLSFRGPDTRLNFTSHLYSVLDSHRVRIFRDDPELRSGEVISDALIQAIHESKTYIVVFSKNYASSPWCLNELVEIFNCHKTAKRLVIPVFYKIDPSVVRHQIGSFERAFKKHQDRFEIEKVNKWRITLNQVANLSGSHICQNRSEADIINKIVDDILPKINPKVLEVAEYPVGLVSRVKEITSILSSETEEGFTKIGLYGMGGVGKTTLGKALFNQLLVAGSFNDSCFLANVREISGTTNGLVSLQEQLINDVLKSTSYIKVYNVEEGMNYIRQRICLSKVLLLIDDIDDSKQFKSLVGQFVSGSVVIITTRDEEMLDKIKVDSRYRYKVNELNDHESLELFTRQAFGNAKRNRNLMVLSKEIVRHASGLPLALEVFGSYLSTKHSEVGWKSYIERLKRVPNCSSIQQRLVISLDTLEDPMLKEIFLDIACCFIRWDIQKVVEILETYYSYADHKIDILKKRCLVNINFNAYSGRHELGMHDLLRDMGREIVRNSSSHEPRKPSRLWVLQEVHEVLKKKNKGTETIEVIMPYKWDALSIYTRDWFNPYNHYLKDEKKGESFTTERFKRMSKLRFLYLKNVNLTGSFELTFEGLRWFCWDFCPLKCLPSDFCPEKLVILDLPNSSMRTLWELNMVPHVFVNLKSVNMSFSVYLYTTPDFTKLPYLETISLRGCRSLEGVHTSIGSLERLQFLDLQDCGKLRSLPDTICNLRGLEILYIACCSNLEALPTEIGKIETLKKIYGRGLTVSKLPNSIGSLTKLVELDLRYNKELETLPDTICNLRSLEILSISGCEKLETLPDQLWKITRLRELDAKGATMLKKLPDVGSGQIALSLENLNLSKSGITALPSGFNQLSNLQSLGLRSCKHLFSIPKLPPNLKWILADGCKYLERLPNLYNLKHLEELDLSCCDSLIEIQGLEELTALRELDLSGCSGLTYVQGFGELTSIRILRLGGIYSLLEDNNLTKRLFQMYSEFGHPISVYARTSEWDDWVIESPYWKDDSETSSPSSPSSKLESAHMLPDECTSESSNSDSTIESTTVYAHLLPNESHNFMGIILYFESGRESDETISYSVKNTISSGFTWRDRIKCPHIPDSLMVIVPKSIFLARGDDHRIKLSVDHNGRLLGIHLLYKTESEVIEDVAKKYVTNFHALKLIDSVLQDIFLDIACFFIGWDKKKAVQILKTFYSEIDHNINVLKKRHLLTINDEDELEMNDLLRIIGRRIASNNSSDEPEKRSRLWLSVDIYEVLEKNKGTEAIECIIPRKVYYEDALKGGSFTAEGFKTMRKLRFLYLEKVNLTGSFEMVFEELRWFCGEFCPLKWLPSEFYPQKLVTLELPHSIMRTMWKLNKVSHVYKNLKTINMSYSEDLTTTPDFTKLPCLETLNLRGCKSLEVVHTSIGRLGRLVYLDLQSCVKLKSLPDSICNLRALKVLIISYCMSLEALPINLGNIKSITELNVHSLTVPILPDSTGHLSNLVQLDLSDNKNLENLPDTICNLRSLETLHISGCEKLEILPDQLCKFTRLRELNAGGCVFIGRKLNLSNLKKLKWLFLRDCSSLTYILGLEELTVLKVLDLTGCNSTLLAYIFTKRFFQIYSEFGHEIQIYAPVADFPDWIGISSGNDELKEFPYWIRQTSARESTMCFDLSPNVSHYFLGMILCLDLWYEFSDSYSVENTTSNFIWRGSFNFDNFGNGSVMVIVPRSIFPVSNGHDRIELNVKKAAKIYGIHLFYKTKGYDSAPVSED